MSPRPVGKKTSYKEVSRSGRREAQRPWGKMSTRKVGKRALELDTHHKARECVPSKTRKGVVRGGGWPPTDDKNAECGP